MGVFFVILVLLAFQQHDVQELCRVMFDALEKKFKGTKQENLINELYQGKIKDYVKCLEVNERFIY
jgi:ubiquitin carboxyl-terminal hydrolase 47